MTITAAEIVTEDEWVVLEDLEFEIPCEITTGHKNVPCPNAADWTLILRNHHTYTNGEDVVVTFIMCDQHYQWVLAGGRGLCDNCRNFWTIRDFLIRVEPIRGATT